MQLLQRSVEVDHARYDEVPAAIRVDLGAIFVSLELTYDVRTAEPGGAARLRRVAKTCRDYGQRVQFSVFEIEVDPAQWARLRTKLESLIKPEHDSLRYYYLGANWQRRVEHVGAKPAADLGGALIV